MNYEVGARQGYFHGESAIYLTHGRYEAILLPEFGANLIAFRDRQRGLQFLREPTRIEDLRTNPYHYGIPVLYPPNRYAAGSFVWNGKTYQLPVNEVTTGNHLHGFLYDIPWTLVDFGTTKDESYAVVHQCMAPGHPVHRYIPHEFTIQIRYAVSDNGLLQHALVRNDGRDAIPCMLGFHTTIKAPFGPDSDASDYIFTATIGDRWILDERMLPTGRLQTLGQNEQRIRTGGVSPFFEAMDNHYTAVSQNGSNRMELTDTKTNVRLIYDVGVGYRQWMIWNNKATEGFFCPEPQTNVVNAPNMEGKVGDLGVISLAPGGIWEETSRMYCVDLEK